MPSLRLITFILLSALGRIAVPQKVGAQQAVRLSDAIEAATRRGSSIVLATLDTAAGRARLAIAGTLSNPILSASYTDNTPHNHLDLALPLDFLFLRRLRVQAAERESDALELQLAFQRAAARYQIVGAYARSAAAEARAQLSRRTALDADSLLQMAVLRENAGDASKLEVELARINLGDAQVRASQDSFNISATLLEVQRLMAMSSSRVEIALADSLPAVAGALNVARNPPANLEQGEPLLVAAARRSVEAHTFAVAAERRRIYGAPSISIGVEAGMPGSTGLLPTIGVSLPVPLLTRNRAEVALATIQRDRAVAALDIARRDAAAALATVLRSRDLASLRVTQTRDVLASAERIASLTLIAYREGEVALSFVLEATRRARDLRDDYITALSDQVSSDAGVTLYSILVPGP